jgi:hypothetical protein
MKPYPRWILPFVLVSIVGLLVWLAVHNGPRFFPTRITSASDTISHLEDDVLYEITHWEIIPPGLGEKPSLRWRVTITNTSSTRIHQARAPRWDIRDNFGNPLAWARVSVLGPMSWEVDPKTQKVADFATMILPIAKEIRGEVEIGSKILPVRIGLKSLPGYPK